MSPQLAVAQLSQVLAACRDMIGLVTLDGDFVYVSPACQELLGHTPQELVGTNGFDLLHPEDLSRVRRHQKVFVGFTRPLTLGFRMRRKDGEYVFVEASAKPPAAGESAYAVVYRDVTERHEWEQLLQHAALQDPVTGLANRRLLDDELEAAVARARRSSSGLGVVFVDLDDFKAVNDRYGHAAGDEVLRAVGARLRGAVRAGDVVARYGGDEFVALCLELADTAELASTAARIRSALLGTVDVDGTAVPLRASVGVAVWDPELDAAGVLAEADRLMYLAKHGRPQDGTPPAEF